MNYRQNSKLFIVMTAALIQIAQTSMAEATQYLAELTEGEVPYSVGIWDAKYGNHRALVDVKSKSNAVKVHIPWRRRDTDAVGKNVIVLDSQGNTVTNRAVFNMSRESADLVFEPSSGPGVYHLYYLLRQRHPNPIRGANQRYFPGTVYQKMNNSASEKWLTTNGLTDARALNSLPEAKVTGFQSLKVTGPENLADYNSFFPMEVIATDAETTILEKKYSNDAFLTFPEDRKFSIRMTEDLPLRWIKRGPTTMFTGNADKNEFYVLQVGVYALKDIKNIVVTFSDLTGPNGQKIDSSALRCFNLGGVDWIGKKFDKVVNVTKGNVQALWIGIQVPENAATGIYTGAITIGATGEAEKSISLNIAVSDKVLADKGDKDLWRMSRLRWLDSTIGLDQEALAPYTPIVVDKRDFNILGRTLRLNKKGLPESLVSHISLTELSEDGREVLDKAVDFVVETESGPVSFKSAGFTITHQSSGKVSFVDTWKAEGFEAKLSGTLECEGYMRYRITLKSLTQNRINDIRVELPFRKKVSRYLMGRFIVKGRMYKGRYSGIRPAYAEAPIEKGLMYNTIWSGDYNAGLGMLLKNDTDEWNGDNKTRENSPTLPGWENGGKGKYICKEVGETALITVHNGRRTMEKDEELNFNFALLLTPFKPTSKDHWDYRIHHAHYEGETSIEKSGPAKIINVHHANTHNPYINYPFFKDTYLKEFTNSAHQKGKKVKLYYTIRELSTRVQEFWALRSLGDEIYIKDDGYLGLSKKPLSVQNSHFVRTGYPWMCEHIIKDYRTRWHSHINKSANPKEARIIGKEIDASIATQGLSRWHNYYLEGLYYLMTNLGVDGIYLDGIGYDREIMKRVRKTMLLSGKTPMIDFHGCVHHAWMTLAPFIDSTWYGEAARYDFGPDYWLLEISGIPFGMSGEILKHSKVANVHRGMLYGMSRRLGWFGTDAIHTWKMWDDFGIKEAKHIGYFTADCPVKSDDENVKVTVYQKEGKSMLAIASWNKQPCKVTLDIDWEALGLDPKKVKMYAPQVKQMQEAAQYKVGEPLTIPATTGIIIIIEHNILRKFN